MNQKPNQKKSLHEVEIDIDHQIHELQKDYTYRPVKKLSLTDWGAMTLIVIGLSCIGMACSPVTDLKAAGSAKVSKTK